MYFCGHFSSLIMPDPITFHIFNQAYQPDQALVPNAMCPSPFTSEQCKWTIGLLGPTGPAQSGSRAWNVSPKCTSPIRCVRALKKTPSGKRWFEMPFSFSCRMKTSRTKVFLLLLLGLCGIISETSGTISVIGCIKTCAFCVENFGKDLYDGKECRDSCVLTKGKTIDFSCTNETFHRIRKKSSSGEINQRVWLFGREVSVLLNAWGESLSVGALNCNGSLEMNPKCFDMCCNRKCLLGMCVLHQSTQSGE